MSSLTEEIILRPRFKFTLNKPMDLILKHLDNLDRPPFVINRLDEHVYIKFKKEDSNFWTPQLHLELMSFKPETTIICGVFGPNPTLWTFFMFLHFGIATLFIVIGVFAYSKHSLGHNITPWLMGMAALILIWVTLYVFGRLGRQKAKPQLNQLKLYMGLLLDELKK